MKFIISLAFKNLWRYRRRTLITAFAIAIGLALFIWMDAFLLGFEKESERNSILFETGSAQILAEGYFENVTYLPLRYIINDPDELLTALDNLDIPATKRVSFGGEIIYRGKGLRRKFWGIDLKTNSDVFNVKQVLEWMPENRLPETGKDEILIGYSLAETLGVKLGNIVEISTHTRDGKAQSISLRIVGLMKSLNPVLNESLGMIPLDVVDKKLQLLGGVTEIPFLIPEYKNLAKQIELISQELDGKLAGMEIYTWDELGGSLLSIVKGKRNVIFVLLFLLGVIAAVGVSNTMLMAVFERIKEIGMMRALGMRDKEIQASFFIEAGGIGLIGAIVGVALALLLNVYTIYVGFDFSWILDDIDIGIQMPSLFRGAWNFDIFTIAPLLGILVSVLVAYFPSRKALKMGITDCLRH